MPAGSGQAIDTALSGWSWHRTGSSSFAVWQSPSLYRPRRISTASMNCWTGWILIAHLQARRETRWPGFGIHTDHPARDDRYDLFINSVLEDGGIRMVFRPLTGR